MVTTPFATLSIHHFISSVGADAGFAAIIGLAIMVLLFFSQARETATLRRRADETEGQQRQLAAYVDQLLRRPAAVRPPTGAAPAPPPAAARLAARPAAAAMAAQAVSAPVPAGAVATIPAAPAGVGAPALSAATRLIPLADPDEISIRSLKNGNGGDPAGAVVTEDAPAPPPAAPPAGPAPSTAAGGANGVGNGATRTPVAPDADAHEATPPPFVPDAPPPRVALRREGPPASARPAPPPTFNDPIPQRRRLSRFGVGAVALVVVVAAVAAVLIVTSSGGNSNASSSTAASNPATSTTAKSGKQGRHHTTAVSVTPSTVTVAVLNGTLTSHLAADVMSKLNAAGYKPSPSAALQGGTGNAPNQSQSLMTTTVGYTQPSFRNAALAVAKSLNLSASSVAAVTAANRNAACQATAAGGTATAGATTTPTGACPAQVVVTVGNDLAANG